MTEVRLVRHGESKHNSKGVIQGQIDSDLTEKGREQARRLGRDLETGMFDSIYSSDLGRARDTAEILTAGEGVEFRKIKN